MKGADTIAIEGNRIRAIGRYEQLQPLLQPHTNVIDAQGKTVLPGLNDTHIHIWKVGNLKTFMLDVRAAKSLDEMLGMLADYHRQYPNVAWVTARGFNEAGWTTGKMPTRHDLDKVIPNKPVYLIRTCAHIAVANTKALELCAIQSDTVVPEGGMMYTDESGKPNGIFSETALGLIANQLPPYNKAELKTMIQAARTEMYRYGITAATDPAVDPLLLEAYDEMNTANELGFRLHALPIILPDGSSSPYPLPNFFSSPFFNVNTVKFFSDGGLSGKTAALKRQYKNTAEQGVLRLHREQYLQLSTAAMKKGLGVATHAIGDAAIEFVIDCYTQLNQSFPQLRKRIEHLGLPLPEHLEAMAGQQIATSMQTVFISELGKNFIRYLDEDYLNHCYPVKSVLQQGILTALSSDAPVVKDFNPMKGMEAAVTRRDNEGNSIAPQEAISVAEALKAYTADAAAISNTNEYGSLEEGKLADFIITDKDPLTTAAVDLTSIQVLQTYVNGQLVWER